MQKKMNVVGKMVSCSNCSYKWKTKSKMRFVNCPSCMRKVRLKPLLKRGRKKIK